GRAASQVRSPEAGEAPPPAAPAAPAPRRCVSVAPGDFEAAVDAYLALAERDLEAYRAEAWALARDPGAPLELQIGVYGASEGLEAGERSALWLALARTMTAGLPTATGLQATQREELGRGLIEVLADQGQTPLLLDELLAERGADRLWVASALHAHERLLGPRGLSPAEQLRLARLLADELGADPRDHARLTVLSALEPAARRAGALEALARELAPESRAGLEDLLLEPDAPEAARRALLAELAQRLDRTPDLGGRVRLAGAYARVLAGATPPPEAQRVCDALERAALEAAEPALQAAALSALSALPQALSGPALTRAASR
ncbi:MAG: hypothetical protein KDD82_29500, partial [Planctomycetes bacterium]|nr:hypothetical protein [Planctomycetota bacterium]